MKRALALIIAAALALALFCSCSFVTPEPSPTAPPSVASEEPEQTAAPRASADPEAGERMSFTVASEALPACWSVFSPRSEDEELIASLISPPLVYSQLSDAETGEYGWAFGLAESVRDVTPVNREDITRFSVNTNGFRPTAVSQGVVFEVKLRDGLCWENGERITADDIIGSLKLLLDPSRRSAAAADLCASDAAPAGCERYYLSQREDRLLPVAAAGFRSNASAIASGRSVMIDAWALGGLKGALDKDGGECPRWLGIKDETRYFTAEGPEEGLSAKELWEANSHALEIGAELESCCAVLMENRYRGARFEDVVGLYKTGEMTFNYVCPRKVGMDAFLDSLSKLRLVYIPYYLKAGETNELDIPFGYCTNDSNTMSCGPYRISGFELGKRIELSRSAAWFGWEAGDDGSPYSFTEYLVSGERLERYASTELVFTAAPFEEASALLEGGEAELIRPNTEEARRYAGSGRLETFETGETLLLLIDPEYEELARMDAGMGNRNSIVLSDPAFRHAVSLAIDRASVCREAGGRPELGLFASNCKADASSGLLYRESAAAKQALCALYGVKYGEGERFAELDPAAASITGFDRTAAHELMKTAFERLTQGGLYEKGDPIRIRVLCTHTAPTAGDKKLVETLANYLNIAAAGTGFGRIRLEAVGGTGRGSAPVIGGEFALGLYLFDGSDPFTAIRHAFDPYLFPSEILAKGPQLRLHSVRTRGGDVILSLQEWASRLSGAGRNASDGLESKLALLASMEQALLESHTCIPLCSVVSRNVISAKAHPLIAAADPFFGGGGFELMVYDYTDEQWRAVFETE